MCIIIVSNAGKLSKAALENAMLNNPHGTGIATIEGDIATEIKLQKFDGLFDYNRSYELKEFSNKCEEMLSITRENKPFILHARLATHGIVTRENIQPFVSKNGDWVFAHNGIFCEFAEQNHQDKSDSLLFFEQIQDLSLSEVKKMWNRISKYAKKNHSKVAVMGIDGTFLLSEGFLFDKKHNVFASNHSHLF